MLHNEHLATAPDCDSLHGVRREVCRGFTQAGKPIPPEIRAEAMRQWGYSEADILATLASNPSPTPEVRTPSDPAQNTDASPGRVRKPPSVPGAQWFGPIQGDLPDILHKEKPLPGTEVKHLLAKLGIQARGTCHCNSMAAKMDAMGPQWSREHIGEVLDVMEAEAAKRRLPFIRAVARRLVEFAIGRSEKKFRKSQAKISSSPIFAIGPSPVPFITTMQMASDAQTLASILPPDIVGIVGIARSGLLPASIVAMQLHRPMLVLEPRGGTVHPVYGGWRLDVSPIPVPESGRWAVIDDTTLTGNSIRHARAIMRTSDANKVRCIYCSVYCNPSAHVKPDLYVRELPWPHILEWNVFNSIVSQSMACDFDGVLCHDCPPHLDDDGDKYVEWMKSVRPKYLPRRTAIPLIVTARLERYRADTEAWLAAWGIKCDELIMGPWGSKQNRTVDAVIRLKAEHYQRFLKRPAYPPPHIFVESDPHQAEQIAALSSGLVVCPTAARCFGVPR